MHTISQKKVNESALLERQTVIEGRIEGRSRSKSLPQNKLPSLHMLPLARPVSPSECSFAHAARIVLKHLPPAA
jgi:hypothetical protein